MRTREFATEASESETKGARGKGAEEEEEEGRRRSRGMERISSKRIRD